MKAIIVMKSAAEVVETPDASSFIDLMRGRGFRFVGAQESFGRLRQELIGAPMFACLVGPMWDGDKLRYETPAAYAELSR